MSEYTFNRLDIRLLKFISKKNEVVNNLDIAAKFGARKGNIGRLHILVDEGFVDIITVEENDGTEFDGYVMSKRGLKAIRDYKVEHFEKGVRFWLCWTVTTLIAVIALINSILARLEL